MIFVTGEIGPIGSNFTLDCLNQRGELIFNFNKLTCAGNGKNLIAVKDGLRHLFIRTAIGEIAQMSTLFENHKSRTVVHFAIKSHVNHSTGGADVAIATNIVGACRLPHAPTDEVCGTFDANDPVLTEVVICQIGTLMLRAKRREGIRCAPVAIHDMLAPAANYLNNDVPANFREN